MAGKVGGAATVAKRLHVSRRSVFNLEKLGLPKSGPGRYDLDACEKWYSDYSAREGLPPEVAVQRGRWLKAKADREEIQLAKERGEVAPLAATARLWEAATKTMKQRLLIIPKRVAPLIVGCASTAEICEVLTAHLHEALSELSDPSTSDKIFASVFPATPPLDAADTCGETTPGKGAGRRGSSGTNNKKPEGERS